MAVFQTDPRYVKGAGTTIKVGKFHKSCCRLMLYSWNAATYFILLLYINSGVGYSLNSAPLYMEPVFQDSRGNICHTTHLVAKVGRNSYNEYSAFINIHKI